MYKAHQGGQSVRFVSDAPAISYGAGKTLWGLAGSASLHDKNLVVTVVNPHATEERAAEVALRGGSARSCRVTVLASADIHAHNDFDNPNAVEPKEEPTSVSGSRFNWTFKPASVTKLEIALD
jgi:alpha-L-arabinofuranosidase